METKHTEDKSTMTSQTDQNRVIVHVVRHGEVNNPDAVFYGRLPNFGLTSRGLGQATTTGKYLSKLSVPIGSISSSPLQRARETSSNIRQSLIAADCSCAPKISIDPSIIEVRSPFEGKTLAYMSSIDWNLYDEKHVSNLDGSFDLSDYETFQQVGDRVIAGIQNIARAALKANQQAVVAVSHGDCCVAVRLWATGQQITPEARAALSEYPSYCSVTSLTFSLDNSNTTTGTNTQPGVHLISSVTKDWDW